MLINSRFSITALNLLPVLLTKNRYNCSQIHPFNIQNHTHIYMLNTQHIERDRDLDEELKVDIIGFRGSALGLLALASGFQIDTLQ